MEFFRLTKEYNEVGFFGGNRSGKTLSGGYMDVMHLTGDYPDWWPGKRFDHPTDGWIAGDTAKDVREISQGLLLGKAGDPEAFGTGLIPGDRILRTTVKHGIADAVESVFVRHVSGGVSSAMFKSYDQGRTAFQGTSQHWIHLDEECDLEIYAECLLRTMTVQGLLYITATPLKGLTDLMIAYMPELAPEPEPTVKNG